MAPSKVLLIGGSGFVGTAVAARLDRSGIATLLPTRRLQHARHLLTLPGAEVVEADVFDPATLARLMRGVDAVVSLVGVLHSRPGTPYGPDFARAHVELPSRLVAAARTAGVSRIVHISALGADPGGPSEYQRSKAAGEAAIRAAAPDLAWTLLRPSVIFGPGDSFLNLFARLLRLFPVLPLGGAEARFQPVYVEDVAALVLAALTHHDAAGQTFDVAGPRQYTLRELVDYVGRLTHHPRWIIPLPESLAMLQAFALECLPAPLMSRDNVRSMRAANVVDGPPQPWGFTATALEAIAPAYLGHANKRARLAGYCVRRP
jgi:NADH dehydrogenase